MTEGPVVTHESGHRPATPGSIQGCLAGSQLVAAAKGPSPRPGFEPAFTGCPSRQKGGLRVEPPQQGESMNATDETVLLKIPEVVRLLARHRRHVRSRRRSAQLKRQGNHPLEPR
jgi:hypothetical protein